MPGWLNRPAIAVALCGVVVTMIAACGATTTLGDAHVAGTVKLCGGLLTAHCSTQAGPVSVFDSHHRKVVTEETGADGRFSFQLSPGTYTLASATSFGERSVVAVARRTVDASLVIPVQ